MIATMTRRGRPPRPLAPRLRRLPQRASEADLVEVILVAAERVLVDRGLEGLTTNRVAEVAGVSVGSLYQYFSNKAAIIRALHVRYTAELTRVAPRIVAEWKGEPFREVAIKIADACVDVFLRQAKIHRVLWQMRGAAELVEIIEKEMAQAVNDAAGAMVALNFASADDAPTIAFVLVHAVDGIGNAITAHANDVDARRVARTFAEMAATYLESHRRYEPNHR